MATTIPEAVTTIPAGTLRLLLDLISYRAKARKELRRKPPIVPRRPPRSCCWTAPPGKWCQPVRYDRLHGARSPAAGRGKHRDCRRANPVQVKTLTSQRVRRVCTAGSVSSLASNPRTAGADHAGLAWSAICCTILYVLL